VSEEIAAEMSHIRRQCGFRSWDEFYRALVQKWNERRPSSSLSDALKSPPPLNEVLQNLKADIGKLRGFTEAQEEAIQALIQEQTQTNELVRRFNMLLAITLEIDPRELDGPVALPASRMGVSAVASSSRKNDVLNKVRRMRA